MGAFARRARVSVRTLQYYDRIGLLKPAARSEAGRRQYGEADFIRLQQIITLKFIGLPLDEIRTLLADGAAELQPLLRQQKAALVQRMRQIEQVLRALEAAEQAARDSDGDALEQVINIIREVRMSQQTDWLGQFLSDEQRAALLAQQGTLAEQKRTAHAWKQLFEELQAALAAAPEDARITSLAERWRQLAGQAAPQDETLPAALGAAFAQIATLPGVDEFPAAVRDWLEQLQAAAALVQQAE